MPNLLTFLSKLMSDTKVGFRLQLAFLKDPEQVMKKAGLDASQRKAVLSKNKTKILAAISSELKGFGNGAHVPHW